MTKQNASRANGESRLSFQQLAKAIAATSDEDFAKISEEVDRIKSQTVWNPDFMSRERMQTEALAIQSLLQAAEAILGTNDLSGGMDLVEMARDRAQRLNVALDSVNEHEFKQ